MILTSDWHLTDNPADEYRWQVFETLVGFHKQKPYHQLYVAGDLSDRKDRHSSILVNRLVKELSRLLDLNIHVYILMGNHDMPLAGPPYWEFLNSMDVVVACKPTAFGKLLLLPWAADPKAEWKGIPFSRYNGIFMHQTVSGVVADNGMVLQNDKMPLFPRGIKIYSGDIHTPQVVGGVTYIGSPHPIKFGDNYPCRMLRLDQDYKIIEEIKLDPPRKHMIDIASVDELEGLITHRGDQARIRLSLPINDADRWPAMQDEIAAWAQLRGVTIASIEATVDMPKRTAEEPQSFATAPLEVLRLFAEAEGIDGMMLDAGVSLLKELEI